MISLRFHQDELLISLDKSDRKPDILALIETFYGANDTFNDCRIDKIRPIESKLRLNRRRKSDRRLST